MVILGTKTKKLNINEVILTSFNLQCAKIQKILTHIYVHNIMYALKAKLQKCSDAKL